MKINEHMKNTWKTITEQIKTNKTKKKWNINEHKHENNMNKLKQKNEKQQRNKKKDKTTHITKHTYKTMQHDK